MMDALIRGARVVDGTGNPWFYGDVAIDGDKIGAITPAGRLDPANAATVVEAAGHIVCPGFIDIQSHSIIPLMEDPKCLSKITQGVTTEIMGEAWTPAPFGGEITDPMRGSLLFTGLPEWTERIRTWARFRDWLDAMAARGVSPNIGSFLGGGTLRQYAKGMALGDATADERATMRRIMAEAMEDGAFGVSYALIYPPDAYVGTDELVDVCEVVGRYGGVYITHLRSEADQFLEGLAEALAIGRRANLPVEVYHLKAAGRANWGKMDAAMEMINAARAAGQDVAADMYPYIAGGTGLSSVLPASAAADGKLYDNLRDPVTRATLRQAALHPDGTWEAMGTLAGPEGIVPVGLQRAELRHYNGQKLSDIAADWGKDWLDTAMDLLAAEGQRITSVYFMMTEENVKRQLQQPWMKISTDAGGVDPAWAAPRGPTHPRAYGTYPRVLGKYVREEGVLTLEDAVRKMTSAVADRIGLHDRGILRTGAAADVVIFDPASIGDRATFAEPHQLSVGVRDVWVNGARVVQNGTHTGATPGRIVNGPGRA